MQHAVSHALSGGQPFPASSGKSVTARAMSTKMLTNASGRQIVANNVLFVHITNDRAGPGGGDRRRRVSPVIPLVDAIPAPRRVFTGPGLTSGVPILAVALAPYRDEAWIGK